MLYLAEVKKTKGFMGAKTEVKLLACERNDKSWSAVPGEEAITADDLSAFGDGALIVINLGSSRQIQGTPEPAGNRILGILQSFSRLLDKTKSQEEEIEQWKESLTYQAEELNRRQAEMESRLEELEGAEEELAKLAAQRDQIEKLKLEADQIKADFERKQAELEGAWEHLRGEQQRLENQQADSSGAGSLSPEQTERLRGIFEKIQGAIAPTDHFLERLNNALQFSEQQHQQLQEARQAFEQDQQTYQTLQAEVDAIAKDLEQHEGSLKEKTQSLENVKVQVQVQQELLETKQDYLNFIDTALQNQEELQTTLSGLAAGLGEGDFEAIDVSQLESMPLGELESVVNNLKGELDKLVHFVNDQEEELTLQQEAVQELRVQINHTDSNNIIALQELEEELKDEQERISLLNETLVGQRLTLRERQSVMRQHLRVLKRRQGVIEVEVETNINLNPVMKRVEHKFQEYAEMKENLAAEISQISNTIQQMQGVLSSQESEVNQENSRLTARQAEYQTKQIECAQVKAKVDLYEAYLQPLEESLSSLNQPLRELEHLTHQFASVSEQQQNLAGELESALSPLMN